MRARKTAYLYSRNCMHIVDASVYAEQKCRRDYQKKRTKDCIHLAVLFRRVCADQ